MKEDEKPKTNLGGCVKVPFMMTRSVGSSSTMSMLATIRAFTPGCCRTEAWYFRRNQTMRRDPTAGQHFVGHSANEVRDRQSGGGGIGCGRSAANAGQLGLQSAELGPSPP